MKYMITGNEGLIGKELVKRLDIDCVLSVDKRSGNDIIKLSKMKLPESADIMFNLAAHCRINESITNTQKTFFNNVIGINEVMEFCKDNEIKKVVNFSSSRVLSKEENPYTASKKYLENLTEAYHQCYGIEYLIIRPSSVYSLGEDKSNRLMYRWMENAKKGLDIPIFGDKNKTLTFTYIDDFLDGLNILMNNWDSTKNKAYNIGGKEEKLVDVANEIIKQTNSKGRYNRFRKSRMETKNRI